MAKSLLHSFLSQDPGSAQLVLDAASSGQISLSASLDQDPVVLNGAFKAWADSSLTRNLGPDAELAALKLFDQLVALGADPWGKDVKGLDVFDYALISARANLVEWAGRLPNAPVDLLSRSHPLYGSGLPALFHVPSAEVARALIKVGFDVQVKQEGNTLLHWARNPEMVELLLSKGVDPSALNDKGLSARQSWDSKGLVVPVLSKMEALLATYVAPDPASVLSGFGKQLRLVGLTQVRERLRVAGINPSQARHKGFSLVGLVIAEALEWGFNKSQVPSAKQESPRGNPNHHKAWRKQVLSILKLCEVRDGSFAASTNSELGAALWLFQTMDKMLEGDNAPAPKTHIVNGKRQPLPLDETRAQLKVLAGPLPDKQELLRQATNFIEDMVSAGLLSNGSFFAERLLVSECKNNSNAGALDDWNNPNSVNLFLRLADMSLRGNWDDAWQSEKPWFSKIATLSGHNFASRMLEKAFPGASNYHLLVGLAHPAPSVTPNYALKLANQKLDEIDLSSVSLTDNHWKWAIRHLASIKDPVAVGAAQCLGAEAERQALDASTTSVSKSAVSRSFRL